MESPCVNCCSLSCVLGTRKKDCLALYPNLRRIGNSKDGFKASNEDPNQWSNFERDFYFKQIKRIDTMGRGRPPARSSQAQQLEAALKFVEIASDDNQDYQLFVQLKNNMAVCSNGVLSAGHPIVEQLTLSAHIDKLMIALAKCGKSLVITETPNNSLSIKGDKLRALVPCWTEAVPLPEPDPPIAIVSDILKEAFKVTGVFTSEAGVRVIEASLLLDGYTVTGTNGHCLLQFWHGINLPPGVVLPKAFTSAIAKEKKPLTGMGFKWNAEGVPVSCTAWFEGGAWIKTQCYQDRWQNIGAIIDVPTQPVELPPGLFEAIDTVAAFNENGYVTLAEDAVQSHSVADAGAQYEVKGLVSGKSFSGDYMKSIAPFVKTIDLASYADRAFFFGGEDANPVRGVIMCVKASSNG